MALWSAQFHEPPYSFLMLFLFFGPAALYWLDWQRYKPLWEVFGLLTVLLTILLGSAIGAVRINDALLGPTHPASAEPRATAAVATRSASMPSIIAARSSWAVALRASPMRVREVASHSAVTIPAALATTRIRW